MYTDTDDFIGLLLIDDTVIGEANTADLLQQMEDKILTDLLGYQLYTALKADDEAEKYTDLLDGTTYTNSGVFIKVEGIKYMLKYLQYFYLTRDTESFGTAIGEFEAVAENAQKNTAALRQKATKNYNIGVNEYWNIGLFIQYKNSTEGSDYYNGWIFTEIGRINILGL